MRKKSRTMEERIAMLEIVATSRSGPGDYAAVDSQLELCANCRHSNRNHDQIAGCGRALCDCRGFHAIAISA